MIFFYDLLNQLSLDTNFEAKSAAINTQQLSQMYKHNYFILFLPIQTMYGNLVFSSNISVFSVEADTDHIPFYLLQCLHRVNAELAGEEITDKHTRSKVEVGPQWVSVGRTAFCLKPGFVQQAPPFELQANHNCMKSHTHTRARAANTIMKYFDLS